MEILNDDKTLCILEIVSSSEEPLGSWNLVDLLEDKGISVSPATIGRILNRLENLGFLKKQGVKGRLITPKGEEAIRLAQKLKTADRYQKQLKEIINTDLLHDYLMVLEARKAIEKATARLAAVNATKEDLDLMNSILYKQESNYKAHKSGAEVDISFHKAIAKASCNKVLEILYSIIALSGQQSKLFEHIREQVRAPYTYSHRAILRAIEDHDPEEAEHCIEDHINCLIEDVNTYWHKYYS